MLLLASFVLHAAGYGLAKAGVAFQPPTWEGRTGWRKPMLFGISNAMVFAALRLALRSQTWLPVAAAAHTAAWSTLLEVAIITLQAWRDEPSHFNTSTPLDAGLYSLKLAGASVLGLVCLATACGCAVRPSATTPRPMLAALRLGLSLLSVAVLVGFGQVLYGHNLPAVPNTTTAEEEAECRIVTAGVRNHYDGGKCYEVYGLARLKILHFVPLHTTEVLCALAMAAERARLTEARSTRKVRVAAVGLAMITLGSAWQVVRGSTLSLVGLARLELEPPAQLAVVGGLMATAWAFGSVALALLRANK